MHHLLGCVFQVSGIICEAILYLCCWPESDGKRREMWPASRQLPINIILSKLQMGPYLINFCSIFRTSNCKYYLKISGLLLTSTVIKANTIEHQLDLFKNTQTGHLNWMDAWMLPAKNASSNLFLCIKQAQSYSLWIYLCTHNILQTQDFQFKIIYKKEVQNLSLFQLASCYMLT